MNILFLLLYTFLGFKTYLSFSEKVFFETLKSPTLFAEDLPLKATYFFYFKFWVMFLSLVLQVKSKIKAGDFCNLC